MTPAEAASLLGGEATLEVHDMQAVYPGSVDFAYQTKKIQIIAAAFYPKDRAEMFETMKKTLIAPGGGQYSPARSATRASRRGRGWCTCSREAPTSP